MKLGIAIAKLDLTQKMYKLKKFKGWVWNINFSKASYSHFSNLLVELSTSKREARTIKKNIKKALKKIDIENDSLVVVLFDCGHDNKIIGIGSFGNDLWFSTSDYSVKKISLDISSIEVYSF